ncbi:hypothetical protein D9M69_679770 [compost metagenome]
MPTMDSDTSSVTPRTGASNPVRPTMSALMSSISPMMISVPRALSAWVRRCSPKGNGWL